MRTRSVLTGLVGALAAVGLVVAACGSDNDDTGAERSSLATQTAGDSGSVSNSSIVANTFLTFDGSRYRLASLEQADLSSSDATYEEVGTADEADIDQADLTVYRRAGDTEAVYTYAPPVGDGDEATPALWYRWVPES